MTANKTFYNEKSVDDFIQEIPDIQKREDSIQLIQLMQSVSKEAPKMFGGSIIGFGQYYYKYPSGHEGYAPLIGFSPRKAAISLYVYTGLEEHRSFIEQLGRFKMGKACIYIKKLSDINTARLIVLMQQTIQFITTKYTRIKD
ncbi:MAG: hypothetical protein K0R59_3814 [Sphingobacterium sp.]|jgi:hypothetical protein|uniref:DUF1801 domain-containing protein n=1 Tax=unclassified Sphingobacterium TaxID=2609468 RepID=UPI0009858731|nr:DUF1801 domain-containing protein [Sphingobacterium sp. CZ-UAM]MDF2518518.1 hypothetical protein [Sphingobacterium sp.]OOG17042.1 hypothetical protein BWD42_16340 [Sphingobacterium sp. CZ-UAM]